MKDKEITNQIGESAKKLANTVENESKVVALTVLLKLEQKLKALASKLFDSDDKKTLEITSGDENTR